MGRVALDALTGHLRGLARRAVFIYNAYCNFRTPLKPATMPVPTIPHDGPAPPMRGVFTVPKPFPGMVKHEVRSAEGALLMEVETFAKYSGPELVALLYTFLNHIDPVEVTTPTARPLQLVG